jgi:hypothetical protein
VPGILYSRFLPLYRYEPLEGIPSGKFSGRRGKALDLAALVGVQGAGGRGEEILPSLSVEEEEAAGAA